MKYDQTLQILRNRNPEAFTPQGFDEALVGLVQTHGGNTVGLYSRQLCLKILRRDHLYDAEEFFDLNMAGARFGDHGPMFAEFPAYDPFYLSICHGQPVAVECPQYTGFGIVNADFPEHQSQPGHVDVCLENGNTWAYPWDCVVKADRDETPSIFQRIAAAHRIPWAYVRP